jgi:hypothetical protein
VQASAFARILLLGPAKAGKSTACATAPSPLVINCDGQGALKGAARLGGKFLAIDAYSRATWKAAIRQAVGWATEEKCRTIVVDSVTLLQDNLLDEIGQSFSGFEKWGELARELVGGLKILLKAPAHLIVTAHMMADSDNIAGIVPVLSGQSKTRIPALLDDWVLLETLTEPTVKRQFLVGPQKNWTASGRNVRRSCAVEPTIPALFAELGIRP